MIFFSINAPTQVLPQKDYLQSFESGHNFTFEVGNHSQFNVTFVPHEGFGEMFRLRWRPEGRDVQETILRLKQSLNRSIEGDIHLYIKTEGKGGVMSFFLTETDNDVWIFYTTIPMQQPYDGDLLIPLQNLSRAHWSQGDGNKSFASIKEFAIEFFSDGDQQASMQVIYLDDIFVSTTG